MKQITSEGKSYLWFPEKLAITQRYQTIGLIVSPEEGNTDVLNYFRIFISANTRKKIEDFVDYQGRQGLLNLKSIQVRVCHLETPGGYGAEPVKQTHLSLDDIKNLFSQAESQPDFLTRIGALNIGIDRVYMETQPPYEIIYTIDPEVAVTNSRLPPISVQFSANETSISCSVSQGNVQMSLRELAQSQTWDPRDSKNVSSGQPASIVMAQKHTGIWQAEFKGLDEINSIFTYDYRKRVFS